jgi:hypothetical protein
MSWLADGTDVDGQHSEHHVRPWEVYRVCIMETDDHDHKHTHPALGCIPLYKQLQQLSKHTSQGTEYIVEHITATPHETLKSIK